jgi:cytochrome c-type biogenesis protein CcmH
MTPPTASKQPARPNGWSLLRHVRKDRGGKYLALQRFRLPAVALMLLINLPAIAVEPAEQLKNPALEARARQISSGLRCLVCQNETIDESNAGLAHDIRILLRERLTAGDTDELAVKAIVDRYGEFVLLDPPVKPATYVLWFGPPAILLAGLLGGMVWLRRRSGTAEATMPLSLDERRRLDTILREADR